MLTNKISWYIIVYEKGMTQMEQQYYSVKQAAKLLGMAEVTIKKWIYVDKTLKAVKVNNSVRIHREELESLISPLETKKGE